MFENLTDGVSNVLLAVSSTQGVSFDLTETARLICAFHRLKQITLAKSDMTVSRNP